MLVPTKKTKILPAEEAPHHTTNAMSLVINTAPSRMLAPTYVPSAPSTDQLPQVIKRNSIVPPHSGLNSSWPPSSVSSTSSPFASSLKTPPTTQSFSPSTTSVHQAVSQDSTSDIVDQHPGLPNTKSFNHENQTGEPHSKSNSELQNAKAKDQTGSSDLASAELAIKVTPDMFGGDDAEQEKKNGEADGKSKKKIQDDAKSTAAESVVANAWIVTKTEETALQGMLFDKR